MRRYERDPWRDEQRELRVHHELPYERGSHASSRADDCSAGRCASCCEYSLEQVCDQSLKAIAFFDRGASRAGGNGSLKSPILKNGLV